MSRVAGVRSRLREWLRPGLAEARMDEEIRFHLELETERLIGEGVEPREARRRALVSFGGVERHREALREGRRLPLLEETWRDLRYAARSLRRTPAFAVAALLTLALGIAAPTVMFTVANALLLRPLPVQEPERLARVQQIRQDGTVDGVASLPEFQAYRERSGHVFSGLASHHGSDVTLATDAGAEIARAVDVSGDYFDVLGVRPALGTFPRGPQAERPDAEAVVVISHDFWRSRFGADSAVIGRVLRVNGQPLTVVGVAPRGFSGALLGDRPAVWLPIGLISRLQGKDPSDRGWGWLQLFGRLRTGVDRERAQVAMSGIARDVAALGVHAEGWTTIDAKVGGFSAIPARMERPVAGFMFLLLAAGALVLLIATTNVAGMLLARGSGRRREMAIRLAIGAGRWRLVRQLLTESLLLAVAAGATGVLGALWATGQLAAIRPPFGGEFAIDFPIDIRVLGFAAALSVVSAVLFGLTPALHAVGRDVVPGLREASPGVRRSRLRGALVAGQLALTLMLLVAAGLFVRTLRSALALDQGFEPQGILAMQLNLELNGYDEERGLIFYDRLVERVRATPGVEAAAIGRMIPQGGGWNTRVSVAGHDWPAGEAGIPVGFNAVSAGYFEAMRMPVLEGRDFRPEDVSATPMPIVVNQTFAQRFWPGGSAPGQVLRFALEDAVVIGVVPRSDRAGEDPRPYAYVPFGPKRYSHGMWLYVRTRGDPAQLVNALRARIAELDPNVPPVAVATVEEALAGTLFPQRMAARFIGGFGLAGLLLAATGLFGLLSFAVAERTREIGVRMALGASRRDVVRMVLLDGMRPLAAGLALGLLGAFAVTRLLAGFLHGLSPTDPATFVAAPMLLLAVSLAAAWLPARRATRVEAVRALRVE